MEDYTVLFKGSPSVPAAEVRKIATYFNELAIADGWPLRASARDNPAKANDLIIVIAHGDDPESGRKGSLTFPWIVHCAYRLFSDLMMSNIFGIITDRLKFEYSGASKYINETLSGVAEIRFFRDNLDAFYCLPTIVEAASSCGSLLKLEADDEVIRVSLHADKEDDVMSTIRAFAISEADPAVMKKFVFVGIE